MEIDWDVVVVGGGVTGLSAALALTRARRRVLVLDGGEPRNGVAPHSHGVLGMDGIPPRELLERGRREVVGYGGRIDVATVVGVGLEEAAIAVGLATGTVRARRLLVATGARDELPPIPGLAERWGDGVVVCPYCDGWERKDGVVGVIAATAAGVHQAAMLRQWADRVVYFENGTGTPDPEVLRRFAARGIAVVEGAVAEVVGPAGRASTVVLADGARHDVDALFTGPRLVPRDDLLLALGATTTTRWGVPVVAVDEEGRTSVPRVFAAGNVVDPRSNVPVSLGWGSLVGATINGDLIGEDERDALEATATLG